MKRRSAAITAVTTGVLTSALLSLPAQSANADSASPHVLSGTVVDAEGSPLAGATIEVYAIGNTDSGDSQTMEHIAVAHSNAHGAFVVAGKLQRQVKKNHDGSIPLELDVTTRDNQLKLFNLDAVAPTNTNDGWTWGNQVDDGLVEGDEDYADAQAHRDINKVVLNMKDAGTAPIGHPGNSNGPQNGDVTAATAYDNCKASSWYNIIWVWTGNTQDRLTPIQKFDTISHGKVNYYYENTNNTKWQVAYTGNGSQYAGGASYSLQNTSSMGVDPTAGNNFHGAWGLNYRFRQFQQFCTNSDWVNTYDEAKKYGYPSGEYKWMAHHWLGGNEPMDKFDMYYCWGGVAPQKMYAPTWVARTSTSTLQGFFGVAGVQLNASQENSSYHKLTWMPDAGSAYVKVCGSNSDPLHASKTREVDY